uniref:Aspartic protease inhibitor n=1 Tax=Cucurbita maxima TaxID=3661 RepID=Q6DKU9_CUCMA|nr:aspartic protease inhibitor [Cucurbita maxima]
MVNFPPMGPGPAIGGVIGISVNDPRVKEIAEFALKQHAEQNLILAGVDAGQIIKGIPDWNNYYNLILSAKHSPHEFSKFYNVVVLEKASDNSLKPISFVPLF